MSEAFNIGDIRPHQSMVDQEEAVEKDVQWLLSHQEKFVYVDCPACGDDDALLEFERKGFKYRRCKICSTVYANPRPSADLLERFYDNSEVYKFWSANVYQPTNHNRRKYIFMPRAKRLVDQCKLNGLDGGVLIEVGSSQGFFCQEIKNLNFFDRVIGIEPTPDQARIAIEGGIETHQSSFEKFSFNEKVNAIASFETIEHLYSPLDFFRWAHGLLINRGLLMMSCPNFSSFETYLLGSKSSCVDHEHLNYFNPSNIKLLAERAGFRVLENDTPGELDVEIIEGALKSHANLDTGIADFVLTVFNANENVKTEFQKFLKASKLSSNMLIIAEKK